MTTPPRDGPRVLVLSATVGSSHNAMADALRGDVIARDAHAHVTILRDFRPLGRALGAYLDWSFQLHFGRLGWSYDLTYLLFTRVRAAQALGESSLYRVAAGQLAAAVAEQRADVVVSTHPVFNPVLSGLRRDGRLAVPAATVCCELGGLEFWLQPELDVHMMIYPEAADVARRSRAGVRAEAIRPPLDASLYREAHPERVQQQLPGGAAPLALISGGGWGLGDLAGAADAALQAGCRVAVVTGKNEQARVELQRRFDAEERVRVLGFATDMPDLLAAADVFVHTTVGISCLEARLRGRPTICFGLFVGHIRDNAASLARAGYVELAHSSHELVAAIGRCLADGRRPQLQWQDLRSAGEVALDLASAGAPRPPDERPAAPTQVPLHA